MDKATEKISKPEEPEKKTAEEQIKKENKTLRNLFIGLGIFVAVLVVVVLIANSMTRFEYGGLKFNIEKFGNIIVYRTFFPVYSKTGVNLMTGGAVTEHVADYNIYIRNDPRKLEEIPFNGDLVLLSNMVINTSGDFTCDGEGVIAVANMVKLFDILGINVIKDSNATCDSQGRYMFLQIQEGEDSEINKISGGCYELNVNNCEILKVTEKFMIETLVKVDESGKEIILES